MEKHELRIVIAEDEPITKMDLKELLTALGYHVVGEAADGFDAVEACRKNHPDLALLDIKIPFLDGLAAAKIINEENLAGAIMMLTAYSEREFIDCAKLNGVGGYLVKPVDEKSLVPSIELAVARSQELKRLRKDVEKANLRLEGRSIIEKAKGRVMEEQGMTEQQAYDYIRHLSQRKNLSMRRVSEIILSKYEV